MENWHTYLTGASKERQQERRGRWLTSLALLVIGALVVTILLFLIAKGSASLRPGKGNSPNSSLARPGRPGPACLAPPP